MAKKIDDTSKINPEPTDVQRAIWRRYKKAGTAPPLKGYSPPAMPKAPKPWAGQKPKYPVIESGADYHTANSLCRKDPRKEAQAVLRSRDPESGAAVRAYVKAFDAAMGYAPTYAPAFTQGA